MSTSETLRGGGRLPAEALCQSEKYRVISPAYDNELCRRPDFSIIRYRDRYLKCLDADFFEVHMNPQLGRSALPRIARDRQRWQTMVTDGASTLTNYRTQFDQIGRRESYNDLINRLKTSYWHRQSAPEKERWKASESCG